jgi:hypothetical protein
MPISSAAMHHAGITTAPFDLQTHALQHIMAAPNPAPLPIPKAEPTKDVKKEEGFLSTLKGIARELVGFGKVVVAVLLEQGNDKEMAGNKDAGDSLLGSCALSPVPFLC